ncbi:MAG: universal stress protein [Methanobacteriota archaeon]
MATARKFLVPVDGSKSSRKALYYAIELAGYLDAEITVFHVVDKSGEKELLKSKRMLGENRSLVSSKSIPVEAKLVKGDPGKEIVVEAKKDYNLIVIGSLGHSGLTRMILGSVAENVARKSPIPVTIVR